MQHTPGPWHFVPSSDARIPDRITNAAGSTIVSGSIGFDPDARLIAAAPDLLAALQALAIVAESVAHLRGLEREILPATDAARAALSKALGE